MRIPKGLTKALPPKGENPKPPVAGIIVPEGTPTRSRSRVRGNFFKPNNSISPPPPFTVGIIAPEGTVPQGNSSAGPIEFQQSGNIDLLA